MIDIIEGSFEGVEDTNGGTETNQIINNFDFFFTLLQRLTAAPNLEESNFAYSQQNGQTVLSRHQSTSTSPRESLQVGQQNHKQEISEKKNISI